MNVLVPISTPYPFLHMILKVLLQTDRGRAETHLTKSFRHISDAG